MQIKVFAALAVSVDDGSLDQHLTDCAIINCLFLTSQMMALINISSAQSDAKIGLLDRKFRTRVSLQDTAFTFGHVVDGVELGCYGYIKDGYPFKMYYVFDEKDYRFITTTMRFQVHPPSGKKRLVDTLC